MAASLLGCASDGKEEIDSGADGSLIDR